MTLQIKAQSPTCPAKYLSSQITVTAEDGTIGHNTIKIESQGVINALSVFPGAVGFGSETVAGRYGQVIRVTNLNASGEGSLRAAIEATGPRVVVFEVSGAIQLTSDLSISNPFISIAGQTAPSPGIMIRGAALSILTHDVLVQHIRVRAGDDPVGPDYENRDALKIDNSQGQTYNVVIDHCSFSWAVDETVSLWHPGIYNVAILNSIISEGLHESFHPKGAHSKGLIVGPHITKVTVYGNLMAHNQQRNIRAGLGSTNIEEVNNLIYNWGSTAADSEGELDVIGNHFIAGEGTTRQTGIYLRSETTKIYSEDNLDVNGSGNVQTPLSQSVIPKTSLMPSSEVYDYVLAYAGARPADRDIVDKRVVNEVKTRTGNFKHSVTGAGGWPVYAENTRSVESDIPVVGPIPSDPNADSDSDGYTNLEEWLHGLAAGLEKADL